MNHTRLIQVLDEPLQQLEEVLERLGEAGGQQQPGWYSEVGMHIRHVWDYYQQLFMAQERGIFDYRQRSRGHSMENNLNEAHKAIAATRQSLQRLIFEPDDLVQIAMDACTAAPTTGRFASSWGREAGYIADHGIHHVAQINRILQQRGVRLPAHFGYAAGTLRHLDRARGSAAS